MRNEKTANVKFCLKLRKFAPKILNMLRKAHAYEAIDRVQCFEWHMRFKSGKNYPVRYETSVIHENVEKSHQLLFPDRQKTNGIVGIVDLSYASLQAVLTNFCICRVCILPDND